MVLRVKMIVMGTGQEEMRRVRRKGNNSNQTEQRLLVRTGAAST